MPKLAFLLACERSIIEQGTQVVSMIGLLTSFTLSIMGRPPENAVIPMEWSIVAGWDPAGGDGEKVFTQVLNIFLPGGKPFVSNNRIDFKFTSNARHTVATKIRGVPAGRVGRCVAEVWAECDGTIVSEKSELSVEIVHQALPPPEERKNE